jgi:peptidoglycan-associated lipoprotein
MKTRTLKSLSIAALGITLAACSSVPLDDKAGQGLGTGQGALSGQVLDPFNPQSILAQQRSVFFEFDSYSVPDQYRDLVQTHARYLSSRNQQRIKIEGHADERGGTEYNLALGQRRANAVRSMMNLLGINDDQIETISFGKEKPTPRDHLPLEEWWAQNRRADIVYQR